MSLTVAAKLKPLSPPQLDQCKRGNPPAAFTLQQVARAAHLTFLALCAVSSCTVQYCISVTGWQAQYKQGTIPGEAYNGQELIYLEVHSSTCHNHYMCHNNHPQTRHSMAALWQVGGVEYNTGLRPSLLGERRATELIGVVSLGTNYANCALDPNQVKCRPLRAYLSAVSSMHHPWQPHQAVVSVLPSTFDKPCTSYLAYTLGRSYASQCPSWFTLLHPGLHCQDNVFKDLTSSSCKDAAIFDAKPEKEDQASQYFPLETSNFVGGMKDHAYCPNLQAVYDIVSTNLVVIIVMFGIAMMAWDFHALFTSPATAVLRVQLSVQAHLSPCNAAGAMHDFVCRRFHFRLSCTGCSGQRISSLPHIQ